MFNSPFAPRLELVSSENARLERMIAGNCWNRPVSGAVAHGLLAYQGSPGSGPAVSPGQRFLEDFANLGYAEDSAILAYAHRWGVLHLCHHGLPMSHNKPHGDGDEIDLGCAPERFGSDLAPDGSTWYFEYLNDWRRYARHVASVLDTAAYLHRGQMGKMDDWLKMEEALTCIWVALVIRVGVHGAGPSDAFNWSVISAATSFESDLAFQRDALGGVVDSFMRLTDVRAHFAWRATGIEVSFHGDDLMGAIATQLALAVGQTDGPVICSGCGQLFKPKRRPRSGAHYCSQCGRGAAQRAAGRSYRERQKAKRAAAVAPQPIQ